MYIIMNFFEDKMERLFINNGVAHGMKHIIGLRVVCNWDNMVFIFYMVPIFRLAAGIDAWLDVVDRQPLCTNHITITIHIF